MSHIWISHVSRMHKSCHEIVCEMALMHEWVTSHVWRSRVSNNNESCLIYECVMSHISMHHATRYYLNWLWCMNKSRHMYEGVEFHVTSCHVTYMNQSCLMYECIMPRNSIWDGSGARMSLSPLVCIGLPVAPTLITLVTSKTRIVYQATATMLTLYSRFWHLPPPFTFKSRQRVRPPPGW